MRRRKSKKKWPEGDRKKRKIGRGKRLRLQNRGSWRNRRPVPSKRNRRPRSQQTLSERMMSPRGRLSPAETTTRMKMRSTSSSR
jgi:hypothetical protein